MQSDERKIKICHVTLKALKYSLLWPSEHQELNAGIDYYLRVVLFFLMTSGWIVSVFIHFIVTLKDNVDVSLSEDLSLVVAFTGIYIMTLVYVKNQPKLALLLKNLSEFDKFGKPPHFDETEKKLTLWSIISLVYVVGGVLLYNLSKLLEIPYCKENNRVKNLNENCGLLTPTWFPFKINYFPVFQLVWLYILICSQFIMKLGLIISYNALQIVYHIGLRIDHLNMMINQSLEITNYKRCKKEIRKCILYHLEILSFSKTIDECFTNCMFAHLTITAAICGCLEKQIVEGENILGGVIHVFGWIFALFLACVGGQHLENKSLSVADSIWSSKWYEADLRIQKHLLIMLVRSQRELRITAGPFGVMSFALFVSVLKMSYSIFAVLNS